MDNAPRPSQLKQLIEKGREQGQWLTYAQVNDHLPDDIVEPDQIEDIINMINDMGIKVFEEAPEDADSLILNDAASADTDDETARKGPGWRIWQHARCAATRRKCRRRWRKPWPESVISRYRPAFASSNKPSWLTVD